MRGNLWLSPWGGKASEGLFCNSQMMDISDASNGAHDRNFSWAQSYFPWGNLSDDLDLVNEGQICLYGLDYKYLLLRRSVWNPNTYFSWFLKFLSLPKTCSAGVGSDDSVRRFSPFILALLSINHLRWPMWMLFWCIFLGYRLSHVVRLRRQRVKPAIDEKTETRLSRRQRWRESR